MSSVSSVSKMDDLASKRRRFQPPITSFFSLSSSEPNLSDDACATRFSHNHYSAATSSPIPVVPAKVQSSLLSVGMRVRKSIADGYKTHQAKMMEKPSFVPNKERPVRSYPTTHAELAPFCGAPKSGNFAVQPHSKPSYIPSDTMNYDHQLVTDDGDAFSLPPSSQESTSTSSSQKRSYDSDELDEFADDLDELSNYSRNSRNIWQDALGLNPTTNMSPVLGRTILSPRLGQQRRRFISMQNQAKTAKQQQTMDIDDFEEPVFLRKREEVDTDYVPGQSGGYEVEMGGV